MLIISGSTNVGTGGMMFSTVGTEFSAAAAGGDISFSTTVSSIIIIFSAMGLTSTSSITLGVVCAGNCCISLFEST